MLRTLIQFLKVPNHIPTLVESITSSYHISIMLLESYQEVFSANMPFPLPRLLTQGKVCD